MPAVKMGKTEGNMSALKIPQAGLWSIMVRTKCWRWGLNLYALKEEEIKNLIAEPHDAKMRLKEVTKLFHGE